MQKQWLKKQNSVKEAYMTYMLTFIYANATTNAAAGADTLALGLDHAEPLEGRLRYGP